MRALSALGAAALLLAGCETAFVGKAPGGHYRLVEVNGRAPPSVANPGHHCPVTVESGRFDLDPIARRFAMTLSRAGPCIGGGRSEMRLFGSYLRRGGGLELEAEQPAPPQTLIAGEAGDTVSLTYENLRLRFRQVAPPR